MEVWRDIKDTDGNYQVSNLGQVKSFYKNGKTKVLKPWKYGGGSVQGRYLAVTLKGRGKIMVHRLVAESFLECNEDRNKFDVDHIDGNRHNNNVSNLRYCTRQENLRNTTVLRKDNTSGCLGVSWNKEKKKWQSQVHINGKHIFLGRFTNYEDAKEKANQKREEVYGIFYHNFET